MIEWAITVIACAMETGLCIFYYDSFMINVMTKLQKVISFIILCAVVIGNATLFDVIPGEYYSIKLLTYIATHMLFVKLCYRSGWVMSIFFSSSAILLQILVQSEICVLFNVNSSDNYIFINLMACLACVISLGIEFVLRKKLILIKDYLKKEPVILKGFIWLPLVTAIVAMFFYVFFVSPSPLVLFQGVVSAILLVINIGSMFFLQESLVKDERLRMSEIQMESKVNQIQAFQDMQSLYERQGRKLHDYKKQLMTVQNLLKNGENETAVEYIEKLTKNIATEMSEVNVGHPVVNAVLNQQYRIAKGKNIGMTFTVSDLHEINIADDDIVVLLGNLLENAIHECEKVISLGRTASIQVKLIEKEENFIITVCNPVTSKKEIEDNKVLGIQKEGHGIGLSNVESVVEKYNGSFVISCDEKEFTAVVMI